MSQSTGQNHHHKSVTLVELLIAISLLGLVILAATSIDLFARRQLRDTDIRTQLINEISPAMEHMVKNILQGIGDINNPGVIGTHGGNTIQIRQDTNGNSRADDSYNITYQLLGNNILFTDTFLGISNEVIAQRITNLTFSYIDTNSNGVPDSRDALLDINITARWDPTLSPDSITNPEVQLNSRVQLRSASIH